MVSLRNLIIAAVVAVLVFAGGGVWVGWILGSSSATGSAAALEGVPGSDGADGRDGVDGRDGIDGTDGTDGARGPSGSSALDGEPGAVGRQGEKGDRGDTGVPGAPGPTGADGLPGDVAFGYATLGPQDIQPSGVRPLDITVESFGELPLEVGSSDGDFVEVIESGLYRLTTSVRFPQTGPTTARVFIQTKDGTTPLAEFVTVAGVLSDVTPGTYVPASTVVYLDASDQLRTAVLFGGGGGDTRVDQSWLLIERLD